MMPAAKAFHIGLPGRASFGWSTMQKFSQSDRSTSRGRFSIPFKALLLSTVLLFAPGISAQQGPPDLCPAVDAGSQHLGLHARFELMSEGQANDWFGHTVSKSYYAIRVLLSNENSGVSFAATGLHFCSRGGVPILTTSARLLIAQMLPKRIVTVVVANDIVKEEFLIPSNSEITTLLFVEKVRLSLPDGKLPDGIRLFGAVSKTVLQIQPLQSPP